MKLKAVGKNLIVEYKEPETILERESGIVVLSEQFKHYRKKGRDKIIRVNNPEDVIRIGKVISSGVIYIGEGREIFFNRHDADFFQYDGKDYYKVKTDLALGYAE